jgi:hypothetical protein
VPRADMERAVADATAKLPKRLTCSLVTAIRGFHLKLLQKRRPHRAGNESRLFPRSLVRQAVQAAFPGVLTPATLRMVFRS